MRWRSICATATCRPCVRRGADPLLAKLPWHRGGTLEVTEGPAVDADRASISHAFAGVAESGTIVQISGADNPTTLNFLPEAHIVVLEILRPFCQLRGGVEQVAQISWARATCRAR